jgi:hypothetical protein
MSDSYVLGVGPGPIGQRGAVVDVERCPTDDQRGYRFDARRLGLGDAVLLFAQMHHFDLVPGGIERDGELLLGGYADRASRVIEDGLVHWKLPEDDCGVAHWCIDSMHIEYRVETS